MHAAMASAEPSGNLDTDFVRLMLPHHQAAIDMAKSQLLCGKDPQLLRLAQEIIIDQQSEIELMQLWLKQHEAGAQKRNQAPARQAGNEPLPSAHASAAVNSLGLLYLVEVAAAGLAPKSQYQVYLAEFDHALFGKLEPLALLKTNPDGAGIVQAIGPLKTHVSGVAGAARAPSPRFLIVTDIKDPSQVVVWQAVVSNGP